MKKEIGLRQSGKVSTKSMVDQIIISQNRKLKNLRKGKKLKIISRWNIFIYLHLYHIKIILRVNSSDFDDIPPLEEIPPLEDNRFSEFLPDLEKVPSSFDFKAHSSKTPLKKPKHVRGIKSRLNRSTTNACSSVSSHDIALEKVRFEN